MNVMADFTIRGPSTLPIQSIFEYQIEKFENRKLFAKNRLRFEDQEMNELNDFRSCPW